MNILLAGGGTGGHVYPALAVRAPRSRALVRLAVSAASVGTSFPHAFAVVARFRPDAMIATGGVAALPTVIAGAVQGIPIVVLEGNAIPGRTNRILARYSRVVAVSSDEAAAGLPAGRTVVTGLPIRREVFTASREEGLRAFALDPGRRTLLIIGGSQGAVRLNRAAEEAMARLASRGDLQVIHQVGGGWDGAGQARPPAGAIAGIRYIRVPYLERIGAAYACADLVVSRCGANALAEITACGLPAILVPYPYAADDHQARNARRLIAAGAAVLVPDAQLTGDVLAGEIAAILDRPGRLGALAAAARGQGRPDAADRVVALVSQLAQASPQEVRG